MLLNCHSYYSLRYGCLSMEEVAKTCEALGHQQVAITDINNTSEVFQFIKLAERHSIHPIVGIDFRNGIQQQYIGLAKNQDGFYALNKHLSEQQASKQPFSNRVPQALLPNTYVIYPFTPLSDFNTLHSHEFIGIRPQHLLLPTFSKYYKQYAAKMVILHTATFRHKKDYNIHRLLRSIGENQLLSKLSKNAQAHSTDKYLSKSDLITLYKDYPKLINNTEQLLSNCKLDIDLNTPKNRRYYTNSSENDFNQLKQLAYAGLNYRYAHINQAILNRLENELAVIRKCNFCAYFLINWDMINYAQKKGYYYVGRGSGANSMVAYLLKITNVDPIDLDLYFERFINPHRMKNPPDFDIDFSWTDRDDITQYLFDKYGHDRVALLGSYQTFKKRATIRELGKVFGLPAEEIKKIQQSPKHAHSDSYAQLVLKYSHYISGFPSHLSIHASGLIISEKPIHYYTATHLPPKNYPTTHFDMQISEDIKLYKFDILSQRGLGKIKDALSIIKKNHQQSLDIDRIEAIKQDPEIKKLMRQGDLTSCFYVESPAMRMLLTKLKAEDYTRLVAASSIIRPGVAKSGMMREYILRFQSKQRRERAKHELPEYYELLKETFGVMVYQEDVIKVAHFFAGLSLADADILRRGMSWRFKERIEFSEVEQKFFHNCRAKGYPEQTINNIWQQIQSFANFAFSKGHSASYAVESFQALYLFAYYPLEYLTATINNGGGFYSLELYIHKARMRGATIELPCINSSNQQTSIQQSTIQLGLNFINGGFESTNLHQILKERTINGRYKSFRNFVDRVPELSLEQVIILIRLGCFRTFEKDKKKLLWDAHFLYSNNITPINNNHLFSIQPKNWELPLLNTSKLEDAYDEIEILGFPISLSPFDLLKEKDQLPHLTAVELPHFIGKTITIAAYQIHIKTTQASNKQHMQFGTFIDQNGHWIDTVIFPNMYRRLNGNAPGCYKITGKVTEEFGHISIEVNHLNRYETINLQDINPKAERKQTA